MEIKKYEKIPAYHKVKSIGKSDDTIYIEEKLDGGNGRITFDGKKLILGTRNVLFYDESNYPKMFRRPFEFIKETLKGEEDKLKNYILYGELMVKHTIDYDWNRTPLFLGFDVYDMKEGKYLDYDKKVKFITDLGFEVVPLVNKCKVKDIQLNESLIPQSKYYDGKAEGVVIKNYDKEIFTKIVRADFKEKNSKIFGGSYKNTNDFTKWIVEKYCTNARIDKCIYKLRDEKDISVGMSMMKYLPRLVVKDIIEEEWDEIYKRGFRNDETLIFKKFNRLIMERCKYRLMFLLQNQLIE